MYHKYMQFQRKQALETNLYPKRALIIYGPRRVGKTTLLTAFLKTRPAHTTYFATGDDLTVRDAFRPQSLKELTDFAAPFTLIALDEAQHIPNVGMGTKMLVDAFPEKQIILTGSSSLYLASEVGEPLTGRHFTLTLLPIAQCEMRGSVFDLKQHLEDFLIYGSYPEVLLANDKTYREKLLVELSASYLYKDALALEGIRSPDLLRSIAKMIAFQIGREVSLNEIAVALHTDVKTVARYLDLLEQIFVIKRVRGLSRNLRNEIHKKARYYFLDNGVRNAVIGNFSPLSSRDDIGALWENFCFMELWKRDNIAGISSTYYFWRTHQGQEIDIVREANASLTAFECKWGTRTKVRIPKAFADAYKETPVTVITPDNYLDILLS
jgi:uncharacterized protein